MFDWNKYIADAEKQNNRHLWVTFLLFAVYTVGVGFALAHIESLLFLLIGLGAYAISVFGYSKLGTVLRERNNLRFKNRVTNECITEFLTKKGLLVEFSEFSGKELL